MRAALHPIITTMETLRLQLRRYQRAVWTVALILASTAAVAAKHFSMPTAHPANTYPAHDEHPNEKVAVGLDPYDMPDKANIFTIHYSEIGFMPIFVVVTNNSDQPISLTDSSVELVTVNRSKISRAAEDDIYRRIANPSANPSSSPLPWPKKVKGAVSKDAEEELHDSQFVAHAVEPHSYQSGFMFFDVSGISTPLAGATVYLTGVRDSKGNELMYFEIPMEKYLSAPASKQ